MNSDMDATKGHFLMEVAPILDEPPHNKVASDYFIIKMHSQPQVKYE